VMCWYLDLLLSSDKVVLPPTSNSVLLGINAPASDSVLGPNAPSSDSVPGLNAPSFDSVAVVSIADNIEVKVKKSGSVAAFGTVDPTPLVASIVDNSVKMSMVKGKSGEQDS